MSRDLVVKRVKRITEELPPVINTEEETRFEAVSEERADSWEKEIGVRGIDRHTLVPTFEALFEITGEKITSYAFRDHGGEYYARVETSEGPKEIPFSDLESFRRTEEVPSYFYILLERTYIESGYLFDKDDFERRLLTKCDVEKMLKEILSGIEEDFEYQCVFFVRLAKAVLAAEEDEYIVIDWD